MTTTRTTYTIVLIEHRDGDWSIEPVGLRDIPGYKPLRVGPMGCYVKSPHLDDLLCDDARAVLETALDQNRYGFDLRFVALTGELLAMSTITYGPPPGGGKPVKHELLKLTPQLRARVDELRRAAQLRG